MTKSNMQQTPRADTIENLRLSFHLPQSPAYLDALHLCRELEIENGQLRAQAGRVISVSQALDTMKAEMEQNHVYAWTCFCDIAIAISESGNISHRMANIAAARLMNHMFDVDIEKHQYYASYMSIRAEDSDVGTSCPPPPLVTRAELLASATALNVAVATCLNAQEKLYSALISTGETV